MINELDRFVGGGLRRRPWCRGCPAAGTNGPISRTKSVALTFFQGDHANGDILGLGGIQDFDQLFDLGDFGIWAPLR